MNVWKVILATLVIFVAGIVTGGLGVRVADLRAHRRTPNPVNDHQRSPAGTNPVPWPKERNPSRQGNLDNRMPRGLGLEFLQRLDIEVRLTPDQHGRIEKILLEGQARGKELWERFAPEMRSELAETQKRIREELAPEQRQRFEELMKQRQPRRPEDSGSPGGVARDPRGPFPPRNSNAPQNPQPAPNP